MSDLSNQPSIDEKAIIKEAENAVIKINKAKEAIGDVIFGQKEVVEQSLVTIVAGGHALLVGVPGLAKTKLVETLGIVLGLSANRVQFTPDLMPSDILGSEILDEDAKGKKSFRFVKGPIFSQLLMADEINRASPRTHEAQLDRFLLQIDVNYPDMDTERRILLETTGSDEAKARKAVSTKELMAIQQLVRQMPVGETVVEAILGLVRSARPEEGSKSKGNAAQHIAWGPGPRASQALMLTARARALIDGRLAPSVDDVMALAEPVLKHRMALNFSARAEGVTIASVIADLKRQWM